MLILVGILTSAIMGSELENAEGVPTVAWVLFLCGVAFAIFAFIQSRRVWTIEGGYFFYRGRRQPFRVDEIEAFDFGQPELPFLLELLDYWQTAGIKILVLQLKGGRYYLIPCNGLRNVSGFIEALQSSSQARPSIDYNEELKELFRKQQYGKLLYLKN